jgi:NADH:ubiquinone oxidoreductase subunit 5 (subunit L)/multisubunit Na+/H+ antiporter MnhA subunit
MEQSLVHLAHAAAWVFLIGFIFAVIGVIATIRWIVNLFTGAERAVESGVHNVEDRFTRHDS